jgi:hypothetical protein
MPQALHFVQGKSVPLDKVQLVWMRWPNTKSRLGNQNKLPGHLGVSMSRSDRAPESAPLQDSNDLADRAETHCYLREFLNKSAQMRTVCMQNSSTEVENIPLHTQWQQRYEVGSKSLQSKPGKDLNC